MCSAMILTKLREFTYLTNCLLRIVYHGEDRTTTRHYTRTSPPWSTEYPSLARILKDSDGLYAPKGNTFKNNISIGCGTDIVFYDRSEIYNNQSFLSGHNVFEKVYSRVASQMVDPKNLNF
jgi:hypothetical protein